MPSRGEATQRIDEAEGEVRPGAVRARCLHCDLLLTGAQRASNAEFCCAGCRTVFQLIQSAGLGRYYDLRQGTATPPPDLRAESHAWLESELERQPAARPGAVQCLTLDLQGIHCAACVWLLRELYRRHPGALDIRINPALGKADLAYRATEFDLRGYLAEVEQFGYRFGPNRKQAVPPSRGLLLRLGISAAAAMNVMIFSLAFYNGMTRADGAIYRLSGILSLLLTAVTVVSGGWVFFRSAVQALRRGVVHLDVPIALGILLGFAGSVWAYLAKGGEATYFDTVCVFTTLMLFGRWMQERVLERNRLSLLENDGVDNLFTRRLSEGNLRSISVSEIKEGDLLLVVPGDLVPVACDAEAEGLLALDWITGESTLQVVAAADPVHAGSWNAAQSALRLRAREDFSNSRLKDLLRSPAPPARTEDPARRREQWFSTVYVTAVLALAAIGFLFWLRHDLRRALEVAISILIVTCPCALGLATPLAHELTHLALRKRGVFLRGPRFLEKALFVKKVLFDKTGTLTLGRLVATGSSRESLRALAEDERRVLWNLCARSNHPASRALAEALSQAGAPLQIIEDAEVVEAPGEGLEWRVGGRSYRLGRAPLGAALAAPLDGPAVSRTHYSVDGRVIATFELAEEIRADAVGEIRKLGEGGYEVRLLSGDEPSRVAAAAASLSLPAERAEGNLTPEGKAARVRALDRGDTLMVGDGLNDGPSFEAAYCAATPAVDRPALPARADFYFLGQGIAAVRRSLEAARRLRQVLLGNLVLTLSYNALALALCMAGRVGPITAAILMPLSSLTVVTATMARLSERRSPWMS